jgi:non-ribosomal peptide synthetase component E (peptide arylation enzyme)
MILKPICELFEEIVDKYPDRIAVAMENSNLTFNALNSRANFLALSLRSMGMSILIPSQLTRLPHS